jgi:hypothetical protein
MGVKEVIKGIEGIKEMKGMKVAFCPKGMLLQG